MTNRQHPMWRTWKGMVARCNRKKDADFGAYGARWIQVCDAWRSFQGFLAGMGERPTPAHSIDRIDVNRGYEPGNCRWATQTEQQRNRTNNRRVEHGGESRTMAEWSELRGWPVDVLRGRLDAGWSADEALGRPYAPGKRSVRPGSRRRKAA